MTFKDILKAKVPQYLQRTPEFPIILRLIVKSKISGPVSLKHWLNVELNKCKNDLKEAKIAGSTMNRKRILCAKRMDLLRLIQKKIIPYLK